MIHTSIFNFSMAYGSKVNMHKWNIVVHHCVLNKVNMSTISVVFTLGEER
jgi:hypothetical protein